MANCLQYFVIYYSPNALGRGKINLGVVLLDLATKNNSVRFIRNWERVQSFHPDGDIELLQAICREIEERINGGDAENIIRLMEDSFSNDIQISERMEYHGSDVRSTMIDLVTTHLRESAVSVEAE
jgi:hypothetical protein